MIKSKLHKKLFSVLTALLIIGITGCNISHQTSSNEAITVKSISFPPADYYSLVLVNRELIALIRVEGADHQYVKKGDSNLQQFNWPTEDPRCSGITDYDAFDVFPDGRLQLWEFCRVRPGTLTYLMAYNWETGKIEEIAGPLPLGSSGASWNPDETRGVIYLDSKFSSQTLYWIWKGGFGPMDLIIKDQGRSWNLKDDFPDFKGADGGRTGNAGRAAWSPDGHSIVFFASPEAIGKTGFDKFYVEYNLYVMSADKLQPQAVLNNIYVPFIIKWSPNSKQIAFIGQYGNLKQDGIWLYSLDTDSVIGIAEGKFQDILWKPDGKGLIAIRCDDSNYCSQIQEYNLTSVIEP